jgi:hypothetical protein
VYLGKTKFKKWTSLRAYFSRTSYWVRRGNQSNISDEDFNNGYTFDIVPDNSSPCPDIMTLVHMWQRANHQDLPSRKPLKAQKVYGDRVGYFNMKSGVVYLLGDMSAASIKFSDEI